MTYSAAQNKASQKYKAANIKRVPLDIPLSEYETFKAACIASGDKVNTVLRQFMTEYVKQHSEKK